MVGALSILSAPLRNPKTNLKIFFDKSIDIERIDHDILNKYAITKFNEYVVTNVKDYNLWDWIQVDFGRFEAKHFDSFRDSKWKLVTNNCYLYKY